MKHSNRLLIYVVIALLFYTCAKKGRPSGGPKDEDAPVFVVSNPPYESTEFKATKIELEFDEYVVLRDLNKQLVVSPPYKNPPLILPQGIASKKVTIQIIDTLKPNTTYIYNFGSSLQDNNEGNKLENFNYVFSTGKTIDSLVQKGAVKDAIDYKDVKGIKMLLYRIDSTYTDSIIFKEKPSYVTSTIDTSLYKFTNVKEGKYFLFALKDAASDYIYNPSADKIGVYKDTIQLPRDSVLSKKIALFKERLSFTFKRAKEDRKGKIIFGFEGGKAQDLVIEPIANSDKTLTFQNVFEKGKDTVNVFHSKTELDSINFIVSYEKFKDTITVKLRKKELDSIQLTPSKKGIIELTDTLYFNTNNPITKIDTSKIKLLNIDSLDVKYEAKYSNIDNRLNIFFNKTYDQKYSLSLLPGAVKDIFAFKNDTIKVNLSTRNIEDYGNIFLNILNPNNIPLIVDLINTKGEVERRSYINNSGRVSFSNLPPKAYRVRCIYDLNNNRMWDTGNYLKKVQPEKVFNYPTVFEVRPFFDIEQNLTINQ